MIDPELVAAALETGSTPLTPREADVLRAAESGVSTDDIAIRLSLSPATVRNYLSNRLALTTRRRRADTAGHESRGGLGTLRRPAMPGARRSPEEARRRPGGSVT